MIPAIMTDTGTKPIPILEADDNANDLAELELQKLVESDNVVFAPSKMIVIRNPSEQISVGISASTTIEETRINFVGNGARQYHRLANTDEEL